MARFFLKAKLAKLDEAPEAYRGAYVERDGAFHLDPAKLEAIEFDDKEELAGALKNERSESKRLRDLAEKYKDLDPEKAREALRKLQDLDDQKLIDKGEFDRLLKKRSDEFDAREAEYKKQLGERDTRLDEYELLNPVREAAIKAGVNPKHLKNVVKITRERFKLNDKRKPVVLDEEGDETAHDLDHFWGEQFKKDNAEFFLATGAGGSGAPAGGGGGGGGGAKTVKRADFDQMTPADRMAHVKGGGTVAD